jgi:hypothetical protein
MEGGAGGGAAADAKRERGGGGKWGRVGAGGGGGTEVVWEEVPRSTVAKVRTGALPMQTHSHPWPYTAVRSHVWVGTVWVRFKVKRRNHFEWGEIH